MTDWTQEIILQIELHYHTLFNTHSHLVIFVSGVSNLPQIPLPLSTPSLIIDMR